MLLRPPRRDIAVEKVHGSGIRQGQDRAAAWCLALLMLLLPFEPRRPSVPLLGLELTLLELAAALGFVVLAWRGRQRLLLLVRRPPLPLRFLAGYMAAHFVSALLAPAHRSLALKFSLRMAAMVGFALLVAAAPLPVRRRGTLGLCAGAALVALLAVVEGAGFRGLDAFLDLFREMPFNVGGSRRASAGSEYPNLAAAIIMYGLVAGVALAAGPRRGSAVVVVGTLLASGGLLFTYSRGALVATALGLACLAALQGLRATAEARLPLVALLTLAISSAAFAWQGEIFRLRLGSEGTGAWYAAVYEPLEMSLSLEPAERRVTRVRVTNTGRKTWTAEEQFHLSYHWYDVDRRFLTDGARTRLPHDVGSGVRAELEALVLAPSDPGRYLLVWDMVHEQTTWFSGQGVSPATVPVHVGPPAQAEASAPALPAVPAASLAWRPSRAELWRLALALWRERPLTGVGSDNFRWLYGPKAGRSFWDSRVFANNTLLEAAATTGALGVVALGGSLLASGVAAFRRARKLDSHSHAGVEAALAFGLVTALAAHGTVDYVLAFTGHYLLYGFVVGIASAPAEDRL